MDFNKIIKILSLLSVILKLLKKLVNFLKRNQKKETLTIGACDIFCHHYHLQRQDKKHNKQRNTIYPLFCYRILIKDLLGVAIGKFFVFYIKSNSEAKKHKKQQKNTAIHIKTYTKIARFPFCLAKTKAN